MPRKTRNLLPLLLLLLSLLGLIHTSSAVDPSTVEEVTAHWEDICEQLSSAQTSPLLLPIQCTTDEQLAEYTRMGNAFKQQVIEMANGNEEAGNITHPVILMPGLAASGLEVKLHDDQVKAPCYKNHDWYRLWLGLEELLPGEVQCWYHNIGVNYNATNHSYHFNQGVQARPIDFGGLRGVDYLDRVFNIPVGVTSVYGPMIKALQGRGYEEAKNLFGAPFDWRLPPELGPQYQFYQNLTDLIEHAYEINGNQSVNLVCHSMGNIHITTYLSLRTQAWKDKYIKSYIALAGPWSGAPKPLRAVISGDNNGIAIGKINIINPLKLRSVIRNCGGITWLAPNPDYWHDQVLVSIKEKNYTSYDLLEMFQDIGAEATAAIYETTKPLRDHVKPPNVDMHCIYGTGVPTEIRYDYPDGDIDKDPIIFYDDDGDGTVPSRSLKRCLDFQTEQEAPVTVAEFPLQNHFGMLKDEAIIQEVLRMLQIHET